MGSDQEQKPAHVASWRFLIEQEERWALQLLTQLSPQTRSSATNDERTVDSAADWAECRSSGCFSHFEAMDGGKSRANESSPTLGMRRRRCQMR
ncbi:hypothetical protein GN244_ATG20223 [Phytophthora infestans]|uniref:Uncharacterized protein n=1 Tax=Phytophthora infestans TaxID=4787 RepID=A0A833STC6_PHYIN|nr:hypothetical protein GN244_ATG20223 [Phytophthora infestans]